MCTLLACHWVPHSPSSTGIWGDSQVPSVLVWLPPQSLAKVASTPGLQILFQGDPSGLVNQPNKLGENCLAHSCPRTLGQVPSPCQGGGAQRGQRKEGCQQGVVTVHKQKVAPSCPPQRMALPSWLRKSGSCREGPQNASLASLQGPRGNPCATREPENPEAERFCNTGQSVNFLEEQPPIFLLRMAQL